MKDDDIFRRSPPATAAASPPPPNANGGTAGAGNAPASNRTDEDDPYEHRVLAWSPSDASGITAATGLVTMASTSVVEVSAREDWEAYEAGQAALAAQQHAASPSVGRADGVETPTTGAARRKKRSMLGLSAGKKSRDAVAVVGAAASASNGAATAKQVLAPTGSRQGTIQTVDAIPYVQVRSLDVAERVAFERRALVAPKLDDVQQDTLDKVSPSQLQVEVLERLYGRNTNAEHIGANANATKEQQAEKKVRQLCWSPAVSPQADPWGGWDDENDEEGADDDTVGASASGVAEPSEDAERNRRKRRLLARKRRMLSRKRLSQISRYSAIDPLDYARSTLPSHSPVLTNTRRRLPVRSDVGFPGATDEEIREKHMEIMRETEIEEHSPRISVLVSSGDLCLAPGGSASDSVDVLTASAQALMEECEGLPDIPLAGRELVQARVKHAKMLSRHIKEGATKDDNDKAGDHSRKDKEQGDSVEIAGAASVLGSPNISQEAKRALPGPDPASIFAPPVGSTYSSTHLWRSAPFADQPPGMVHVISIPTAIQFGIGDIEPLVCSLAIYCLPQPPLEGRRASRAWSYRGKISEDFVFPAGKWPEALQREAMNKLLASTKGRNLSEGEEEMLQQKRPNKAIFSYDPLALPPSDGRKSLYFVLQIQKVVQANAASTYLADNDTCTGKSKTSTDATKDSAASSLSPKPLARKRSVSSQIKKKLGRKKTTTKDGDEYVTLAAEVNDADDDGPYILPSSQTKDDIVAAETSARAVFSAHGTKLLSPICFGVLPLFPRDEPDQRFAWPNGSTQTMDLFTFPGISDSQDDFIERLAHVVNPTRAAVEVPDGEGEKDEIRPISGQATIFSSIVGVDFTQVLLQEPEFTTSTPESTAMESDGAFDLPLPRLLGDITGDCAIMMSSEKGIINMRKRSDLVRLPPAKTPSGYADLCEFREVLYLPPRPERLYDNDVPTSPNRLLNLLYLYPRQLRLGDDGTSQNDGSSTSFTVRICLVRRQITPSGEVYTRTESIYNSCPFGSPMVDSLYTKIGHGAAAIGAGKNSGWEALMDGIPLHDEVKVRLPNVLDGSHFLRFSLFTVKLKGDGSVPLPDLVSETFIPLSSASAKEPVSKERVVTVIPNGVHRIKLGGFQLLLESRLVSSIHSSDPGVSMVLRDFTRGQHAPDNIFSSSLGRVMKKISGQAAVTHFRALVFLHMEALLGRGCPELPFKEARRAFQDGERDLSKVKQLPPLTNNMAFFMNVIRSLLVVISKSKSRFCGDQSRHIRQWNVLLLKKFYKEFFDCFDESLFSTRAITGASANEDEKLLNAVDSSNASMDDDAMMDQTAELVLDSLEDSLIERTVNAAVVSEFEQSRYAKSLASSNRRGDLYRQTKSEGLLRTAYGASKTDRMRVEAEMHNVEGRYTELFDDDETVVTAATFMSRKSLGGRRMYESAPSVTFDDAPSTSMKEDPPSDKSGDPKIADSIRQWGLAAEGVDGDGDIFGTPTKGPSDTFNSAPFASFAGEKAKSMAQRINTVAQVVMTPCMAPNLSSILAKKAGVSPPQRSMQGSEKQAYFDLAKREHLSAFASDIKDSTNAPAAIESPPPSHSIRSPGSDIELNGDADLQARVTKSDGPRVRLRGTQTLYSMRVELAVKDCDDSEDGVDETKPYLYECILALWLQAWLEYIVSAPAIMQARNAAAKKQTSSLRRSILVSQETITMFSDNMDVLLPLCLKSFALRCSSNDVTRDPVPSTILDSKHMHVLEPLVDAMAQSLVSKVLRNNAPMPGGNVQEDWDTKLVDSLEASDSILDFLVGLLSIVHPAQCSILIFRYFKSLRACENDEDSDEEPILMQTLSEIDGEIMSGASTTSQGKAIGLAFRRTICSRQLRLRAIERLSTLPRFVALNFPYKYSDRWIPVASSDAASWDCQSPRKGSAGGHEVGKQSPYPDGCERLPHAHWLADLLANECFAICSQSCEAVVNEAIAQIKASRSDKGRKSALRNRHGGESLSRSELLRLQSNASHAVSIAYELLVRRHALDERFQSRENRQRIAAMFLSPIFGSTIKAVPWLAKMESTHKIRSLWLLSFLHTTQEAPEVLTREKLRSYCNSVQGYPRLHRFIRALRLCSSTCQGFISKCSDDQGAEGRTWLVQECYNTVCALLIIAVDECTAFLAKAPREQSKLALGVFDVLLHVLSMPLSSVAHQRALGAASQALSKFGAALSVEAMGDRLQHWARVCLSLMNAPSLSVRSIAVDVVISLLGGCFDEAGNLDEIALVFMTVLPEVVAREMALYSVAGHLKSTKDVERSVWPLRRALADMEEANPQDDDRIDPQLSPFLSTLCRGCQAIIDGVLIELRLKGDHYTIVGSDITIPPPISPVPTMRKGEQSVEADGGHRPASFAFDADEESIYEAASSFLPETGPLQRLRWLLTLKTLHEEKGQWVEAAETLMLCATTVADALPHVKNVWRPSRFNLWRDSSRSIWLSTVGEEKGLPDRGNTQVMEFAEDFLEPSSIVGSISKKAGVAGMLERPTVSMLCAILCGVAEESIDDYLKEAGMESHAYQRFEQLLKVVMGVADNYVDRSGPATRSSTKQHAFMEENAALRKVSAALNGHMTRLAERMLLIAQISDDANGSIEASTTQSLHSPRLSDASARQFYVRVELVGKKIARFCESTSLPTFCEWNSPTICRVPSHVVQSATASDTYLLRDDLRGSPSIEKAAQGSAELRLCLAFSEPLLIALSREIPLDNIVFGSHRPSDEQLRGEAVDEKTYLVVSIGYDNVAALFSETDDTGRDLGGVEQTKRFLFRNNVLSGEMSGSSQQQLGSESPANFVEYTVAREFPCALSRQRTLLQSEFVSST